MSTIYRAFNSKYEKMYSTELKSFVSKFHQLKQAGQTAHLDLDTYAGKARVGLRVMLNEPPVQIPKTR